MDAIGPPPSSFAFVTRSGRPCSGCSSTPAPVVVDGVAFCGRCGDHAIAAATGWPVLPEPPAAEVITGPDGRSHTLVYRITRWPGGVTAYAEEIGAAQDTGYHISLFADHDGDVRDLLSRLLTTARAEIAQQYLEADEWGGWGLVGDEIRGRLTSDDDDELPLVVIDGRPLPWRDLGRILTSYEGWSIEIHLGREAPPTASAAVRASARPASAADLGRAELAAFVIDTKHYPTPDEWRRDHGPLG